MKKQTVIVITGPTASGKSALAVELAKRLDTEIVSADSRQIYRGIPIVTAVPDEEEKQDITHHFLEILPLDAYYSAAMFEEEAINKVQNILKTHDTAVVCGGSMMYVDAFCHGIDEIPTVPDNLRQSLMEEWREKGDEWLLSRLRELDSLHYEKVDRKNMKRVFHAVEVSMTAGKPYSSLLVNAKKERPFEIIKVFLDGERPELFHRINTRVERMMEKGLEGEARSVYDLRHLNSLNTVGLKEMFAWFDGTFTKEEAVARIQKNTRVYAKKQITWYKNSNDLLRLNFSASPMENAEYLIKNHIQW